MRKFLLLTLGLLIAICIIAGGTVWFLKTRAHGFSARAQPTAIEAYAAKLARSLALPPNASEEKNPVAKTPEVLEEGLAHWADHCAVCHANNGSGESTMGKQMYPPAPDMRKEATQKLSDGELFYVIENGVRLSGMPAWGGLGAGPDVSWKLVHFIRHLPDLSREEIARMEKLNPKSPEDIEREQEEEQFLNGSESTHAPKPHEH